MKFQVFVILILVLGFVGCNTNKDQKDESQNDQDYYQFQRLDLSKYDLDATIMIPNETAGIGAAFKPQIIHEVSDYKWEIHIGRNFALYIEDYGDNSFRYLELRKKLVENTAFKIEIIKEEKDQMLYKRRLDNSYQIFAVKKIGSVFYEFKSRDEGDNRKVAEFMYRSVKSFKKKNL
jgi:hypothetical protein